MIKIGHASINENGNITGGKAGDQTGKEVCIRSWYNKGWNKVIRAKDTTIAEKIATAMEQACRNDNIGYNQSKRTTLFTLAKSVNFNLSKITTKCDTDCSALVAVCVNAAGISVSKDIYTGNEAAALKNTGKFEILTDKKYLTSDVYLKRGDILLKEFSHTAVALENGVEVQKIKHFSQYKGASNSFVDALKAIGANSTFAYRKQIANANGIQNYTGTATQNNALLTYLKNGMLLKP